MSPRATHLLLVALVCLSSCAATQRTARTSERRLSDLIANDPNLTRPVYSFETLIGSRTMSDEAGWAPLDRQIDIGIAMQTPLLGSNTETLPSVLAGLRWDFGLRYAGDDASGAGGDLRARTIEATGGLMLEPSDRYLILRPYVGGGLSLAFTDVEETVMDEVFDNSDTVTSGYVRGGFRFQFSSKQHFGIDFRYLTGGSNDVDGIGASAESMTISLIFGARF